MQIRESGVPDSYHRKRAASSWVADYTNPQRPPASPLHSVRNERCVAELLGHSGHTHTHRIDRLHPVLRIEGSDKRTKGNEIKFENCQNQCDLGS